MFRQLFLLENRTSLKLVQKISNCYRRSFKNYYFDRFGILDSGTKYFDLPKEDHTDFIDACLERADELSKVPDLRIAFSGGVDTTFLLALFKAVGKEIKLIHFDKDDFATKNDNALYVSKKIMRFANENYDFTVTRDSKEHVFDGATYTACLADGLFFPTQAVKGGWEYIRDTNMVSTGIELLANNKFKEWKIHSPAKLPNLTVEGWCRLSGNGRIRRTKEIDEYDGYRGIPKEINFYEEEIESIKKYASLFHKPMDSNWSIVRLINFCFCYYQFLFEHPFEDKVNTKSFFDTQKFTNIAWTQYWDANKFYPPDKSVEYKFIRKVFGTDFGVRKNW